MNRFEFYGLRRLNYRCLVMTAPSPSAPSPSPFPATRWSVVLRANTGDERTALQAVGELLKIYWRPLYVFARRSGLTAVDAEDAVQDFCADVVRLASIKTASESRGKLRSFLLSGFQNHLRTMHRDQQRQKRGGSAQVISLDDAEDALMMDPVDGKTPDKAFDRRWAHTLLDHVLQRLRAEYEERGRGEVFAVLESTLVWNGAAMSHDALARKLGMNAATVAQNVKRLRERYRKLLEQEIADTVDGPEAAESEREHLIQVLASG
ncbi:MAG: sigma-70 family RNA polymerase sigma factor [Verrucomicrobiales bacterium]|nr:sigma-70 family RNA polymerase sigma factor [Verrucomicrobiales bacterium]